MLTSLLGVIAGGIAAHVGTELEQAAKDLAMTLLRPLVEGQPREITENDVRQAASAFNELSLQEGGGI